MKDALHPADPMERPDRPPPGAADGYPGNGGVMTDDQPSPRPPSPPFPFFAAIYGYVAGAFAAAACFGLMIFAALVYVEGAIGAGLLAGAFWLVCAFLVILLSAWPGFILLRWLMFWLGRSGWPSFLIMVTLNAVLTYALIQLWLLLTPPETLLQDLPHHLIYLLGPVAGLAAWFTERRVMKCDAAIGFLQ